MTSEVSARESPAGYVGVIGPSAATPHQERLAEEVGRRLAGHGAVVVTGGHDGVMAAASRGAHQAGGLTLGLLPGTTRHEANPYLTVSVPTGLGEMRNALLVRSCAALIAIGGSWGTLSEIALAVRTGIPVYLLDGWRLDADGPGADGPVHVGTAQEAVDAALQHLPGGRLTGAG